MKKLFSPLLLICVIMSCNAQDTHLEQFYHKYDSAGAETTKGTINLALLMNFATAEDSSNGWWKKVTMCRFLAVDPAKSGKAGEEWGDLTRSIKEDHFEEWMSFRQGKGMFRVLSRDRRDGQEDIVCLAMDEHGGGVFFHLRGRFDAGDKAHIQASMQDREGLVPLTNVKN
jgi:hypothetical protein